MLLQLLNCQCIIIILALISELSTEEIWQHDLSNDMKIGASTEGYDHVGLKCGAESMTIELKTIDNFSGVIYTHGSYHSRKSPCFIDPVHGRSFTMNIPLDECETEQVGDRFSNVIVIQHDDELITPGDAAFNLECDFSSPRDLIVTADLNGTKKKWARASIALLDADPGRDRRKRAAYIDSNTNEVTFIANNHRKGKDEL